MDEADIADIQVQRDLAAALANRKPSGPEATGKCLYCATEVGKNMRWCDAECRDAWQDEQPKKR